LAWMKPPAGANRQVLLAGSAILACAGVPAWAQTPAPSAASAQAAAGEDYEVDELVVTATRQTGTVIGDIPPELQLSPRDIRAYGVSSVADLVTALAPQTTSGQGRGGGRPIILVNGVRVSSFSEVRDLPTEAIQRVDILPEEVALKYGYRADQRVINLVLRQRFRAVTAEAGYEASTQKGGGDSFESSVNILRIQRDSRLMLSAEASGQSQLLESERDLAQPRTDAGFRTLVPEDRTLSANTVLARSLREGLSATVNASADYSRTDALLGADTLVGGGLDRQTETTTGHLGGTMAGAVSGWRWTATANADRTETDTNTERNLGGLGFVDRSNAVSTSADAELLLNGSVFQMPAGPVTAAVTGGLETLSYESDSLRAGVRRSADLSRDTASAQLNLDVPITSRNAEVLAALGNFTLNFNVAADELSDFGTMSTIGGGFNWSPVSKVRVLASFTDEDGPPTVQQLGDPETATPGVQVYDFATGQTAVITRVTGGNPGLQADNRQVLKLGFNVKPLDKLDLTFSADYVSTKIEDVISSFPTATTQIEAAFPERFIRNAQGQLVQIDARPVNFNSRETEQLRYGFTFRRPLGRPPTGVPSGGAAPGSGGAAAGPTPGGRPGFGGPGFGGGRGGNLQIGLYHTVLFKDEIVIRPGVPTLDLLDGAAIGSGGGEARNQVDLQLNVSKSGYGAAVNARWTEGSVVRGSGAAGSEDLTFSDLTTVNLRLFADLGAQPFARRHTFFRGSRVSLSIDNLFDDRQEVRDPVGATPVSYQPDYLDPMGRTMRLSFRKLFF
jgi:iron complex outermembrane recepter protein